MANLDLTLPGGSTPSLQLYARATGLAVGSPISGSALSGRPTRFRFDLASVANGDYTVDLSGPAGGFVIRKETSDVYWASQFWELDNAGTTGSGARSVTITVTTTGAVPIQGANVRVSRTGYTYTAVTNASGVATFSLDDATWAVTITAPGYTFTPVSLVVDGTETVTYQMTATGTITPSPAGQVTGYWVVYDKDGVLDPGAKVYLSIANFAKTSTGLAAEDTPRAATADGSAIAAFTGLFPGATYTVWLDGATKKFQVTVPSGAVGTVALGSIVG